jgi:hypothetical protein
MSLAQLIEREPGLIEAYRHNWAATVAMLGESYSWGEIAAAFATIRDLQTRVAVLGGVRPAARCMFKCRNVVNRNVNAAVKETHNRLSRERLMQLEHAETLALASIERNKILLQVLEALTRIATALEKSNECKIEKGSQ